MNLNKIFFCLLFVTLSLEAGAQKKYVILEFETKMPVRDAQVQVDSSSSVVMTNYRGECVLSDKFKKISISSPLHEPLTLDFSQVRDTIILLPNVNRLNEVVINGDRPPLAGLCALSGGRHSLQPQLQRLLAGGQRVR